MTDPLPTIANTIATTAVTAANTDVKTVFSSIKAFFNAKLVPLVGGVAVTPAEVTLVVAGLIAAYFLLHAAVTLACVGAGLVAVYLVAKHFLGSAS